MQDKAFEIAELWIHGNYRVYNKTQHMYEKYNVNGNVAPGKGGEYDVVIGFGWSNGVALDLLYTYFDRMKAPEMVSGSGTVNTSCLLVSVLMILAKCLE
jgi:alpha,alpha-trehalase